MTAMTGVFTDDLDKWPATKRDKKGGQWPAFREQKRRSVTAKHILDPARNAVAFLRLLLWCLLRLLLLLLR